MEKVLIDERDASCLAAWPEAGDFEYDPRCCRFPKSCSAGGVRVVPRYYLGRSPNYGFPSIIDRKTKSYMPFAADRDALQGIVKLLAGVPVWWAKWHSLEQVIA